jgi:hypothetical protein
MTPRAQAYVDLLAMQCAEVDGVLRVVAIDKPWALDQLGHTPRCPDCRYSIGGGQKVSRRIESCPVHKHSHKSQGVHPERGQRLTEVQREAVQALLRQGMSVNAVALATGHDHRTVSKIKRAA